MGQARSSRGPYAQPQRLPRADSGQSHPVIPPEARSRLPNKTPRARVLLSLLAVVITLGVIVAFLPGLFSRSNTTGPNGPSLTVQVNVPSATVTVDGQARQTTAAGRTAPFSKAIFSKVTAGQHTLIVHADNFRDATGSITVGASNSIVTAWLAPTEGALVTALQQLGTPTPQPDPGRAGDYAHGQMAVGTITISIKYALSGLTPTSFLSEIVSNEDSTSSPFKPVTLSFAPTLTFSDPTGAGSSTWFPTVLPISQFGVQVTLGVDSKGVPQFLSPTAVFTSSISAQFPGPAGNDLLLSYTLASLFPTPARILIFTCVGAGDNANFNPEDGLALSEAGGAHFFYRWGQLWATNSIATALAPDAPYAMPGSNEFDDANTARANGRCGNAGYKTSNTAFSLS